MIMNTNYGNLPLKQVTADSDLMNIKKYIPNEADMGRRVLCLYRVSTDKQVTYNEREEADIPMQRQTGRRFLEQQGWVLVHEEREDGVSGHKVRAEKRDSIQYIKELALAEKFDILLVFMFDRIGRIADETPFVVEWLIKHGIRVWSMRRLSSEKSLIYMYGTVMVFTRSQTYSRTKESKQGRVKTFNMPQSII